MDIAVTMFIKDNELAFCWLLQEPELSFKSSFLRENGNKCKTYIHIQKFIWPIIKKEDLENLTQGISKEER